MATTSRASRSFPTLRYLGAPLRWLFGSRRRVLTAATVLLATIAAPVLWWSMQLLALPDIGDPFDVRAFRAMTIPDDDNAYVLYRQAVARLASWVRPRGSGNKRIDLYARWSQADESVRAWLERNREAMAMYRRGTERPDALDQGPPSDLFWKLGEFHALALLEASRLEEEGDMTGAWGWYRAGLRAIHHVGRHAGVDYREWAERWHGQLQGRAAAWAADRRTTPTMLRHALDDAIACGALMPSDSYTIRAEYLEMERALDDSTGPTRGPMAPWSFSVASIEVSLTPDQVSAIQDARRFWRRDRERSRRVIRLVLANWLAREALPPDRRPPADPDLAGPVELYAFGPEAPANARALSPRALDGWLATTVEAQWLLRAWNPRGVRVKEKANHRALVVSLASELYRRDHGTDPPSEQTLVGPYLESLPDDGFGDAGDAPGPQSRSAVH